jgi:hypothetical protein
MAIQLTDANIGMLLSERKELPEDFLSSVKLKSKMGHKEFDKAITGENGSQFRLIMRQSEFNPLDFSIILIYLPPKSNQQFRLRRYNGKSHEHTNKIEKQTFFGFHIHTATERYQQSGYREDAYAEETDRYAEFHSAIECMIRDCGFVVSDKNQSLTQWGMK